MNHFWRLLNDLHIPHITLLDLDREREGGGWGRIKYVLKQLVANGYPKEKLLKLKSGKVMTDAELEKMNEWDVHKEESMQLWIKHLENFNVFFSAPLDIDFLMLENFGEEYKGLLEEKEGPRLMIEQNGKKEQKKIIDIEGIDEEKPDEYEKRIQEDIRNTLKKEGGDGSTYNEEQKKLMVWYNYFFLNRGKPSTHILALSKMDELDNIPSEFERLIRTAEKLLNIK